MVRQTRFVAMAFALAATFLLAFGCSDDDGDPGNNNQINNNNNVNDNTNGNSNNNNNNNNNANTTIPQEVDCPNTALTPPASGTCAVTAGSALVVMQGTVLAPTRILRNGQVAYDSQSGTILCADCDCSGVTGYAGATRVDCANGVISPGLINMHDHLNYAQNGPAHHGTERYEHRHDWREGIRGHTEINYLSGSHSNILWGELRMMLGGVTSIQGASGEAGLVRNLEGALGGLKTKALHEEVFPLDDIDGTLRSSGCNYGNYPTAESNIAGDTSFVPHISEGIDVETRNEFLCTSSTANGGHDLLEPQTAIIHAVGLEAEDVEAIRDAGAKVIWSPRTNVDLYGNTTPVTLLHNLGVPIALGTDWIVSGSINLLRELQCADELNQRNYDGFFSDYELWRMVTSMAALTAHMNDVIGALAPGKVADVSIFDGAANTDYRAIIDAEVQDVVLVVRGGLPLVGDASMMETLGQDEMAGCEALDVCGVSKRVCAEQDTGSTIAELQADAGGSPYPLFYCTVPNTDEPSCVPMRPDEYTGEPTGDDADGDGIPDAQDNCPRIFNPIRPVDDGAQGDADGDGVGDVCDPCPMQADVTDCTTPDPDDTDGDGILNGVDNCPYQANADQADADSDYMGDACDACPNQAFTCLLTIMQIQNPDDASYPGRGAVVTTSGVVTAVGPDGYFIQDTTASLWSGVYIFTGSSGAKPDLGVTVEVTGSVVEFYDFTEFENSQFTVTSATPTTVTPVALSMTDVMNGAATAEAYEGVLVSITGGATCSSANPDGSNDYNEMEITDGTNTLRVDDILWDGYVAGRTVGTVYTTVQGHMYWSFSHRKILPRSASDLVEQ